MSDKFNCGSFIDHKLGTIYLDIDDDYIYLIDENDDTIFRLDPEEAVNLHTALERALFENGGLDG